MKERLVGLRLLKSAKPEMVEHRCEICSYADGPTHIDGRKRSESLSTVSTFKIFTNAEFKCFQ